MPVSFSTTTSSIDSKYWLQSTGEKSRFLPGLQDKKISSKKQVYIEKIFNFNWHTGVVTSIEENTPVSCDTLGLEANEVNKSP